MNVAGTEDFGWDVAGILAAQVRRSWSPWVLVAVRSDSLTTGFPRTLSSPCVVLWSPGDLNKQRRVPVGRPTNNALKGHVVKNHPFYFCIICYFLCYFCEVRIHRNVLMSSFDGLKKSS